MALYVYGLVDAARSLPPDLLGVADAPPRLLPMGDVGVVVSDLDDERVDLDMEDVAAHAAVVDALFAAGTVLPFRVGMAGDETVLRAELEPRIRIYADRLRRLEGQCELEVRAWLEEEAALASVLARSPRARSLSQTVGPGSSFDEQLRLGELLGSELEAQKQLAASALDEELAPLAVEISVMAPAESEAFRAAYLVSGASAGDFARRARIAEQQMPGLHVDVAGPVPPYSFADPPPDR
ncbi:MAG: GvpL/GvpF family gas vesicle protein [Candidatus Dormibacteraeota bacterium]|nr:GvpL/GvpF family gas vesicle protein [Candidatus Dormibacteraeota bacterium]